ncbi:MAG: hypothetical protein H0W83_10620 [Planctomycetes bacterium]|nr:hypothetical protein [Planctomycetota bacterium]
MSDPNTADLIRQLAQGGRVRIDCATLSKLPTAFLREALRVPSSTQVTLVNVAPDVCSALEALALCTRFQVEKPAQSIIQDLPFTIGLDDNGVLITVDRTIAQSKLLDDQGSHRWLRGLTADKVTLDFGAVDQVNSMLVAWLLQLAQSSKPARVVLRRTKAQVQTQLKQLRLDQMMDIG